MLRFVYNLLIFVIYPLFLPYWFFRMIRRGGYSRDFLTRLACYPARTLQKIRSKPNIWVHAVSVGEVYVAIRILDRLRKSCSDMNFIFTTNTSTGYRVAERELAPDDTLLYFPSELYFVMRRAVSVIRPVMLILTECEIWPNLICMVKKRGGKVVVINGRLSDSSFKGYKTMKILFEPVVRKIDFIFAQTPRDKSRFIKLGAESSRVEASRSCKYDLFPGLDSPAKLAEELKRCGFDPSEPLLVGGSTWPGEESILLKTFREARRKFEKLKLVLVPRHAERGADIAREIERAGFSYVRRSQMSDDKVDRHADVALVDTTGELLAFYGLATVVFVGKSLTEHGGQNFIEPAAFGKAILVGPNLENFPVIAEEFRDKDAFRIVQDGDDLTRTVIELLVDDKLRQDLGANARNLLESRRGVVSSTALKIKELLRYAG